jgi:hypothetical protein
MGRTVCGAIAFLFAPGIGYHLRRQSKTSGRIGSALRVYRRVHELPGEVGVAKYRVFIEAVRDPEDPVLIQRLCQLSKKDRRSVEVMLDSLPAVLAGGVERPAAEGLRDYLEPLGATILLKELRESRLDAPESDADGASAQEPVARLGFFKRLSWGFEIFTETWGRQLLLLLVIVGITIGAELLIGLLSGSSAVAVMDSGDPMAGLRLLESPGFLVGILLVQLVAVLAGVWYQATLIRLVGSFMENGGADSLGSLMGQAWRRVPELTTAIGLVLLPLFLGFGVAVLGGSALLLPQSPGMLAFLVLAASLVLLAVSLGFALTGPVAVLESLGPWRSVKRSWTLSRGRRWRLFGNLFLLILGMVLIVLGLQLLFGFLLPASLFGDAMSGSAGIWSLLSLLLMLFVFVAVYLLGIFLISFLVVAFYFEARVVSEGWKPRWAVVPHPSWPIDEADPAPPAGRGLRAWLEMALYTVLALALLWGSLALLSGWMLQMMPHTMDLKNGELSIRDPQSVAHPFSPVRYPSSPVDVRSKQSVT